MNPWQVTTDEAALRRLGKTAEELSELQAVLARIIIQGVDEIDPSSGKTNRTRMEEETADAFAQLSLLVEFYKMDSERLYARIEKKALQMREWETLVEVRP